MEEVNNCNLRKNGIFMLLQFKNCVLIKIFVLFLPPVLLKIVTPTPDNPNLCPSPPQTSTPKDNVLVIKVGTSYPVIFSSKPKRRGKVVQYFVWLISVGVWQEATVQVQAPDRDGAVVQERSHHDVSWNPNVVCAELPLLQTPREVWILAGMAMVTFRSHSLGAPSTGT